MRLRRGHNRSRGFLAIIRSLWDSKSGICSDIRSSSGSMTILEYVSEPEVEGCNCGIFRAARRPRSRPRSGTRYMSGEYLRFIALDVVWMEQLVELSGTPLAVGNCIEARTGAIL